MGQPIAFFEVVGPDHERAQSSCRELFDRHMAADLTMGGYRLVDTGAGEHAIGGGIGPSTQPGDFGRFAIFTDLDGNQVGLWA